eukprot:TRINITY_DN28339_c0_g2_i1.p1 TRINITY_DN28339_c0_g2~~TRINITY_DN28339_c0_g2_i1.p1  ORF type:complete len:843 (+),score=154.21 TRINITY_DN28339_c0_g2_i1:224-2530(+)
MGHERGGQRRGPIDWGTFQVRLQDLIQQHYRAFEDLARDLVEVSEPVTSVSKAPDFPRGTEQGAATAEKLMPLPPHEPLDNGKPMPGPARQAENSATLTGMPRTLLEAVPEGDEVPQSGPGRAYADFGAAANVGSTPADVPPASFLDEVCQPHRETSQEMAEIESHWQLGNGGHHDHVHHYRHQHSHSKDDHNAVRLKRLLTNHEEEATEAARMAAHANSEGEDSLPTKTFDWDVDAPGSVNRLEAAFVKKTNLHREDSSASVAFWAHEAAGHVGRMEKWARWWQALKEPKREGYLARFERHKAFEVACAGVIIINTVYIIYTSNDEVVKAAKLGFAAHQPPTTFNAAVDNTFFVFYSCELALRIWVHRLFFFIVDGCSWNWLDFFLVMISAIEILVSNAVENFDLAFLRVLRLLKISKLLRVVRAVRFLSDLRIFMECLSHCALSLFWAMVMIGLVLLVFSLFFVQAAAGTMKFDANTLHDVGDPFYKEGDVTKAEMTFCFGSVQLAMLTLLEIACGFGDWRRVYLILAQTGKINAGLFVFFILFFVVAVWNIVTSVFLENTLKMTQPDKEAELLNKHRKDVADAKELMKMCQLADADGSGTVSLEEFEDFMSDETFRQYFEMRGIDIKDTELFFHMIVTSTGSTEVDLEAFVGSCFRVKGLATSIDLHTLAFESKMMHQVAKKFYGFVEQRLNHIDEKLMRLGQFFRGQELRKNAIVEMPPMTVPSTAAINVGDYMTTTQYDGGPAFPSCPEPLENLGPGIGAAPE